MSAFLVSDHLIDAVVTVWARLHGGGNSLEQLEKCALMLRAENLRSLEARYGARHAAMCDKQPLDEAPYAFRPVPLPVKLSKCFPAVLRLLDCYSYQACESSDWEQTEAYVWVRDLRERICSEIARNACPDLWDAPGRDVLLARRGPRR